jgi:hypothetical protein
MNKLTIKEQVLLAYYSQYLADVSKMLKVHSELPELLDPCEYQHGLIQLDDENLMSGLARFPLVGDPVPGVKVVSPMVTPKGIHTIENLLEIPSEETQVSKLSKVKGSLKTMTSEVLTKGVSDYLYRLTGVI